MQKQIPTEGFARLTTFIDALGIGRSKFYELVNEGVISKPRKIGRIAVWPVAEVRRVIAELAK